MRVLVAFTFLLLTYNGHAQQNHAFTVDSMVSVHYYIDHQSHELIKTVGLMQRDTVNPDITYRAAGPVKEKLISKEVVIEIPDTLVCISFLQDYADVAPLKSVAKYIYRNNEMVMIEERDYCYNGQLVKIFTFSENDPWLTRYCNGQISYECTFDEANPTKGISRFYYLNGNVKEEGEVTTLIEKGGPYVYHVSAKHGTWRYFNESGKLVKEADYHYNKLLKEVEH